MLVKKGPQKNPKQSGRKEVFFPDSFCMPNCYFLKAITDKL